MDFQPNSTTNLSKFHNLSESQFPYLYKIILPPPYEVVLRIKSVNPYKVLAMVSNP